MKASAKLTIMLFIGVAVGAMAVHGLHAQAKPPVFYVGEIDVTDEAGYQKEFVPQAGAAAQAGGPRSLSLPKIMTPVGATR